MQGSKIGKFRNFLIPKFAIPQLFWFFRKKVEIPHMLQLDLHSEEGQPLATAKQTKSTLACLRALAPF
jgi:hypothetical protein